MVATLFNRASTFRFGVSASKLQCICYRLLLAWTITSFFARLQFPFDLELHVKCFPDSRHLLWMWPTLVDPNDLEVSAESCSTLVSIRSGIIRLRELVVHTWKVNGVISSTVSAIAIRSLPDGSNYKFVETHRKGENEKRDTCSNLALFWWIWTRDMILYNQVSHGEAFDDWHLMLLIGWLTDW